MIVYFPSITFSCCSFLKGNGEKRGKAELDLEDPVARRRQRGGTESTKEMYQKKGNTTGELQ